MILWNIFHQTSLWDTYSRYLYTRADSRNDLIKSDRITNFSSAHNFSIWSDSTNAPAPIRSWSSAILLATWIGVGSETSTQQLVILSVIFTLVEITLTTGKHLLEHGLSCVNSLYTFSDVNHIHIHIPVDYGMSKPCCISWANTVCVHWTDHDALVSVLINDVARPPIVTPWIDIISLTFLFNHDHVISILNFPVNDYVVIQLAINCLVLYFLGLMSRSWSAFVECDRLIRITGSYLSWSRADLFWNRGPGDQRILWRESRDPMLWAHNGVTWMFALQYEQGVHQTHVDIICHTKKRQV